MNFCLTRRTTGDSKLGPHLNTVQLAEAQIESFESS